MTKYELEEVRVVIHGGFFCEHECNIVIVKKARAEFRKKRKGIEDTSLPSIAIGHETFFFDKLRWLWFRIK